MLPKHNCAINIFAMQLNLYRIPHQRQLFKLTTVKQGSTEASNYNKQVKLQKRDDDMGINEKDNVGMHIGMRMTFTPI